MRYRIRKQGEDRSRVVGRQDLIPKHISAVPGDVYTVVVEKGSAPDEDDEVDE